MFTHLHTIDASLCLHTYTQSMPRYVYTLTHNRCLVMFTHLHTLDASLCLHTYTQCVTNKNNHIYRNKVIGKS